MDRKQRPTDDEIIDFENRIRDEQVNVNPLISPLLPISILRDDYVTSDNPNFLSKLKDLEAHFVQLRKTRGDGNCFFRALAFSLVETIISHFHGTDRAELIASLRLEMSSLLETAGFEPMAYEDFFEELFTTLQEASSADWLAEEWQTSPYRSHSLVVLLRLMASAHLRLNAADYEPFLWELEGAEGGIVQFCQRWVECMGVESDQIHIIAVGRALRCNIEIAYLDGSEGKLDRIMFAADDNPRGITIHVLYRPGHYDLLYPAT